MSAYRHSNNNKLKNYLKEHRHGFLMTVSLLLLLSFIAKDILRDGAREKSDTAARAREALMLRIDALQLPERIMKNIKRPDESSESVALSEREIRFKLEEQMKTIFTEGIATIHMVDALKKLGKVLLLSDDEKARLKEFEEQQEEPGKALDRTVYVLDNGAPTAKDLDTAKGSVQTAVDLEWRIIDLGTLLADKADETVEAQEKIYTWSAYALYGLSIALWFLAFLGKRYDIDLPEASG